MILFETGRLLPSHIIFLSSFGLRNDTRHTRGTGPTHPPLWVTKYGNTTGERCGIAKMKGDWRGACGLMHAERLREFWVMQGVHSWPWWQGTEEIRRGMGVQ